MPWLAPLTGWALAYAVLKIAAVLFMVAYYVMNIISKDPARPIKAGGSLDQSNTFGFDNFVNNIGKEYPLSIIYGEYKNAGNRFYTEILSSHNNNNVAEICIGIGEGEIEGLVDPDNNLKLNNIPWKDITSPIKSYTLHTGTTNQAVDSRVIQSAISVDNNTLVSENNGEVIITGNELLTTEIKIGLQAPSGLYKIYQDERGVGYHSIEYSIYYRQYATSTWICDPIITITNQTSKLEFSEYEIITFTNIYPSFLVKTAIIAEGKYTVTQLALALQTAMNAVGDSAYTVTYNNLTRDFTISSNLSGGDGVFVSVTNGDASVGGNSFWKILYNTYNITYFSDIYGFQDYNVSSPVQSFNLKLRKWGKTSSNLRWEESIILPSTNRYEIKVINHNPSMDEFLYIDTFNIDYFSEYVSSLYAFPYTAYLALTIEANEQAGGSIPNITYIVKGLKVKNWNTSVIEWTDNPIWCLIDFMTNSRYGLGSSISITDIDLTSAIESADYCNELVDDGKGGTEKRYILNIVIDVKMDPKEIIQMIASTCNLAILYVSGQIIFKIDKLRTPVMSFNMDNIIKGSFGVRKSSWANSKTNRILVQYQDKDNDYEREFAYKDDDEEQLTRGIIEKSINGYGITRRSQALREAQFFMNANRTLTTTCSFQCGLKNLFAGILDNIYISHDITGWVNEEFTIVEIEEEEDEIMTLTCVVYDVSVYDFTTPSIADSLGSTFPNPETATPHVIDLKINEQVVKKNSGDIVTSIEATWQNPTHFDASYLQIQKVEIFVSNNGGQSFESKGSAYSPSQNFTISNVQEITDDNKLSNYSFEEDLGQWELITTTSGEGTLSRSTVSPQEGQYSALINNISIIGNLSGEIGKIQFRQNGTFSITKDNLYGVKFKAKTQSGESRFLSVDVINSLNGYSYSQITKRFILSEIWQDCNVIFKANESKSGEIALAFLLGESTKDVYLDSIRLHETGLYQIRALAYNEVGKPANIWTAPRVDIVVIGKQNPPAQVANFSGGEYGDTIVLRWDDLSQTEYDLAGYEIRRGVTWNSGVIIDTNIVGTRYTIATYKKGTQRYWIKAIDTSGNYSLNGSYIQINAVNAPIANIIYTRNELQHTSEATFSNTEMVWHEITVGDYKKCIALQTTDLYDETGDTWDSGVIYDTPIRTSGTYATGTIDSLRLSTAQITLDMDTTYLTTGGGVSVSYEIKTSEDNIVWSSWQTFAEGKNTFRYFQFKITWAGNGLNNLFIYKLILDIDVPEFVLRGRETIATASAGASFTYSSAFVTLPTLSVTVIGSTALIPIVTAESTTGATIKLKNLSDVDSTGVFDWTATGY